MTAARVDRLRELLTWSLRSPYYARAFGEVDLTGDDEFELLARLPILDRETVQGLGGSAPSQLSCVSQDAFVRVHHTSGSTGAGSLWVYDTSADWDSIIDGWTAALRLYKVGPSDRALVCSSYGRFIGFWGLHDALVRREVLTVSGADLDTVGRATLIERLGITLVAATPSYAERLGREARGLEHRVRLVLTSGEPRPTEARRRLERTWGCTTADTAGMTEIGTISMVECPDHPGDMHVLDDVAIEEVLDGETRAPVADGELGVRVVTPLTRRGMPLIRYWTNDLVEPVPPRCNCGLGERVYRGGIRGRLDEMVKIRGVWFLPSMLFDVVASYPDVEEHRSAVMRGPDGQTELHVELELDKGVTPPEARDLAAQITAECKRSLGFKPHITLVPEGTLPRPEGGKLRRFHRGSLPEGAGVRA